MEKVGRYKIAGELARGGMGVVYAGYDPKLDREVAIKVVHDTILRMPGFRERFAREARSAARLIHPNIVQIFDADEEEGVPYIVMELVRGTPLSQAIAAGSLAPERALEILDSIAGALDFAHASGISHRDVKPDNLILTGEHGVKLLDFGIAKNLAMTTTLTGANEILASPRYASPEQLRNEKVDAPSDQFSLGAVAYELLTGQRAFDGNFETIYMQIAFAPRPRLAKHRAGFSEEAEAVMSRALAISPGERFSSCREFTRALRAALENPVEQPAAPAIAPAAAPPPRRRPFAVALGMVVLLAAAGLFGLWRYNSGSRAPADVTPPETPPAEASKEASKKEAEVAPRTNPPPASRKPAEPEDTAARDRRARLRQAAEEWQSIRTSDDANAVAAYIERYPEAAEIGAARQRLSELQARRDRDAAEQRARDLRAAEEAQRAEQARRAAAARIEAPPAPPAPPASKPAQSPKPPAPAARVEAPPAPPAPPAPKPVESPKPPAPAEIPARAKSGFERNPSDRLEYAWIAPGSLTLGCVANDCGPQDSKPRKAVVRQAFRIARTEVTAGAYAAYLAQKNQKFRQPPSLVNKDWKSLPVVNVTAAEAQGYCRWIGGRLPTEDEWEYAARAGAQGLNYVFGNKVEHNHANFGGKTGLKPAGSYPPNGFGLFDVMGNAAEWTVSGGAIVIRGGHYASKAQDLRLSAREPVSADQGRPTVGFRCVW